MKRHFKTLAMIMVCMAVTLCASCKKDDDKSEGGGGNTGGYEYVDLGLPSGLLWATCNVGANKPEDYGNYYAWGETTTKNTYDWDTYRWCGNGDYHNLTKYNTLSSYGTVDNRTVLDITDDVAHANWGGAWRMHTKTELQELLDCCTWTWTTLGENKGYRVTGPNGESIFLPAAGYYDEGSLFGADEIGSYWSSSLDTGSPEGAYDLVFNSDYEAMGSNYRCYGQAVRLVCPSRN